MLRLSGAGAGRDGAGRDGGGAVCCRCPKPHNGTDRISRDSAALRTTRMTGRRSPHRIAFLFPVFIFPLPKANPGKPLARPGLVVHPCRRHFPALQVVGPVPVVVLLVHGVQLLKDLGVVIEGLQIANHR